MGSLIELNDTLQITAEQGFPKEILDLEQHQKNPVLLKDVENKVFEFKDKSGARIYHPDVRVFLVHNINGKWLYWGKAEMLEQTIYKKGKKRFTKGKYKIIQIYDPLYQVQITNNETPKGKNFFE